MTREALAPSPNLIPDHEIKQVDTGRSKLAPFYQGANPAETTTLQACLDEGYFFTPDHPACSISPDRTEAIATFLREKTVTILPVYQEEKTVGEITDYLIFRYGGKPTNIIAVIAPPPPDVEYDRSAEIIEEKRVKVVFQEEILDQALKPEEVEQLGIAYPPTPGKGNTVLSGEILYTFEPPPEVPDINQVLFINHMDSDIKNPYELDILRYLAGFAVEHGDKYLQIRAARGGRNNEPIHEAIKLLKIWAGKIGRQISTHMRRIKWPLSGQSMEGPEIIINSMRASDYSIEIATHIGTSYILSDREANPRERQFAQVDIPTPCIDSGNDPAKEQIIESLINAFLYETIKLADERNKLPSAFTQDDFREFNHRLQRHVVEYYLPIGPGANQARAVRQGYAWPSLWQLEAWNVFDKEKLKQHSQKKFGRRFPSVTIYSRTDK